MALIQFVNGLVWLFFGALMAVPALSDPDHALPFVLGGAITIFAGAAISLSGRRGGAGFRPRHAFVLTTTTWLSAAIAGSIPLCLTGLSVTDAFFETMSGLTTTGSTVLTGLDTMPRPILVWRALLQWVGGIGIIVTGIAILPVLKIGGMQLFRAESSDKDEKELATAAGFAAATFRIYLALTALCILAYEAGGMSEFDAILHGMTTLSTGGYSTHDASMGYFTEPLIHWSATLFMLAGSLPFVWYIRAIRKRVFASEQIRIYLTSLAVMILALTLWRVATASTDFWETLRLVAFSLVSVVTTTGFAAVDYTLWGGPAIALFVMVTFFGGCTGSTAGGMKAMRLILVYRFIHLAMRRVWHPHGIFPVKFEGHPVSDMVRSSVIAFFSVFLLSVCVVALTLNMLGLDFQSSVSGAVTALANVGPGIGPVIGPAGTFQSLPASAKWVLSAAMLLGRLEILTVVVVFSAAYWTDWQRPQVLAVSRTTKAL